MRSCWPRGAASVIVPAPTSSLEWQAPWLLVFPVAASVTEELVSVTTKPVNVVHSPSPLVYSTRTFCPSADNDTNVHGRLVLSTVVAMGAGPSIVPVAHAGGETTVSGSRVGTVAVALALGDGAPPTLPHPAMSKIARSATNKGPRVRLTRIALLLLRLRT